MSKYNYFSVINVSGTDFPTDPQVQIGFMPDMITFLNRGGNKLEYSFDGTTVHGDMDTSDASKSLAFSRVEVDIWFRAPAGSSTVRVEAWGTWGSRSVS